MTLTRWKLLAGVFGLSVCGFAALAEPACRTVGYSANRQAPLIPEVKPKGSAEVKPKPAVPEIPVIDLIVSPTPPAPATIPYIGVTTPAEVPPVPAQAPSPVPDFLPAPQPVPMFSGPLVTQEQFDKQLVKQEVPLPQFTPIPSPILESKPEPKSIPLPVPSQLVPMKSNPFPEVVEQPVRSTPTLTTPITPVASTVPAEKKLKVTLQMDENNPKFEVRDGEEVVLKVVSNKVDVASPTQKGERWSTLKASGQVRFMTPGGDGFCDELQVVPGTGEVIAVGHVKFTYNWGKVETSASAEKMNFRLGAQSAAAK